MKLHSARNSKLMVKALSWSKKSTITTKMTNKPRMGKMVSNHASFLLHQIIIIGHSWDCKKPQVTASRSQSVNLHLLMMFPQSKSIHKCNNRSKCFCRTTFLYNRCLLHLQITRLGSRAETIMKCQSMSLIKVSRQYLLTLHFQALTETPFSIWWKWAQYSQAPCLEGIRWSILLIRACFPHPRGRCLPSPFCITTIRRGTRLPTIHSSHHFSSRRISTIIPKWLMSRISNKTLIIICA